MPTINFLNTYTLMAINEEVVPPRNFFPERYFPTDAGDIFASDKVLTEYRKGDRKMAAFVSRRAGDIPMDRRGYAIHEYEPTYIAPSRLLTIDELNKRGFGEAIYSQSTPAERAARLLLDDMNDMELRISRRLEWMAAQTMINNACTMQTYVDDVTKGEAEYVQFYDSSSDHTYAVGSKTWTTEENFRDGVRAMCRMLTRRGLPAADLVMGVDVADSVLSIDTIRELLDKNSGINFGAIDQRLTEYEGVTYNGWLNVAGNRLNLFTVDEEYVDESDQTQKYFPSTSAMVTSPGCGHMMYGQITQIDYGAVDPVTYVAARVPKFSVNQDKDIRKLRLATRPLAAPKTYCPYIYADSVVS
jgi:hypothetical protein